MEFNPIAWVGWVSASNLGGGEVTRLHSPMEIYECYDNDRKLCRFFRNEFGLVSIFFSFENWNPMHEQCVRFLWTV